MQITLSRMIELLRGSEVDDWVTVFERLAKEVAINSHGSSAKILSMYGGMGSLNDLVLYKNGHLLVAGNDEFDSLKTKLFDLCHE